MTNISILTVLEISRVNNKAISAGTFKTLATPSSQQKGTLTNKLIARLALTGFLWFAANMCYYGIHFTMSSLHGNIHLNFFLLVLAEISANLFTHLVALPYFGRKCSLFVFLLLCSTVLILSSVVPTSLNLLRMVLTLVGKFSATAIFNSIYFYTCELFPTNVRSTTMGVCCTLGRLGGMMSVFLAQLSWVSPGLPPALMSFPALISAGLSLLLPETRHLVLPDTFHQADNIGATATSTG